MQGADALSLEAAAAERRRIAEMAKTMLERQDEAERAVGQQRNKRRAFTLWIQRWELELGWHYAAHMLACGIERRAMQTWLDNMDHVDDGRMLLRKAVAAMSALGLRRALSTWAFESGRAQLMRSRLLAVVNTLRQVGVRRALNTLEAHRVALRRLKSIGASLLHRHARRAWNEWCSAVSMRRSALALARRAMSALRHHGSRRALNQWMARVHGISEARRRLQVAAREWSGGNQRAAWLSWRELVARRHVLSRAARGMRSPAARQAFTTWTARASDAAACAQLLRRAMASLRAVGSRRCWNTWTCMSTTRAASLRRLHVAAREWSGGRVRAGWQSWCELACVRRMMRRAASGLAMPSLRRALSTWAFESGRAQLMRSRLLAAVNTLRQVGVRRALNTLQAQLEETRRLYRVLARALTAMRNIDARHALMRWADGRMRRRGICRRVLVLRSVACTHLLTHCIGGAFRHWRRGVVCARRIMHTAALERCAEDAYARDALRGGMHSWARAVSRERSGAAAMRLREQERELHKARRTIASLQTEVGDLRRALADTADERAWRVHFEQEIIGLRKALEEAQKASRAHEGRSADLEEQYRRLWRATHDPNYIGAAQTDEPLIWRVPASKDVVDKLQQAQSGATRHTPRIQDLPYTRSAEDAARCSRSSVTNVSTFSSRQMRTSPSAHGRGAVTMPGSPLEISRKSELWPGTLRSVGRSPPDGPTAVRPPLGRSPMASSVDRV